MSRPYKYSDLTEEEKGHISKYLIVKPKESFIMAKQRKKYQAFGMPDEKIIKIYELEKGYIWLPYFFSKALLGEKCPKPPKFPASTLDFTGQLLETETRDQKTVVKTAIEQLTKHKTTTLWLHPGFGKTVLGARLACYLNVNTLVIHSMGALNEQWRSSFNNFTNATVWVVGNDKNPPDNPNVVICMDTRLSKLSDTYLQTFGLLIIDEAHTWCSTQNRVSSLMRIKPKYIIVESATVMKEDDMHRVIHHIAGIHHIRRDYQKEFRMLRIRTKIKPEVSKTALGTNMAKLRFDLSQDKDRNKLIYDLVKFHKNEKILIVSWRVDHCQKMYKELNNDKVSVSTYFGNAETYSDARVIIGTFSKVGTGFDESLKCKDWNGKRINLVIMSMLVKDVNFFEQVIGRGLRAEYPSFIALVDDNDSIKRHWHENNSWLKKHNCKVYTVDYNDPDKVPTFPNDKK